jgi:hypothetical protein
MYSRDILLHSDQMVLEMIRGGGWSDRAIVQRRPRVSKLGLKRLSDYYFSEIEVEAARDGRPVGQIKELLSRNVSSKRKSLTTALSLTQQGQKAACQKKYHY